MITSIDALVAAFTGKRQKLPFAKTGSLTSQVIGQSSSFWRAAGFGMGAGAIPTAPVTCNNATLGGLTLNPAINGDTNYLGRLVLTAPVVGSYEVHDRLAHMGGLSGTVLTAQPVGLDLNALGATDNISERIARPDYRSVQWWLEWYGTTGATAAVATIAYTDAAGTAKTTTVPIPASTAASRLIQIVPNADDMGIRSVESVTLSVSTATAGNFGVTATVQRSEVTIPIANVSAIYDWTLTGLPPIYNQACLVLIAAAATGTTVSPPSGTATIVAG